MEISETIKGALAAHQVMIATALAFAMEQDESANLQLLRIQSGLEKAADLTFSTEEARVAFFKEMGNILNRTDDLLSSIRSDRLKAQSVEKGP